MTENAKGWSFGADVSDDVELDIRKERMLEILSETDNPVLTTAEIADGVDIGKRATHNHLKEMAEAGLVNRKQSGSGSVWWLLTNRARTPEPRRGGRPAMNLQDAVITLAATNTAGFAALAWIFSQNSTLVALTLLPLTATAVIQYVLSSADRDATEAAD